jgi:hypothetical protein
VELARRGWVGCIADIRPGFSRDRNYLEEAMIGKGHPETKENAKELRKRGDDLFLATDSNLLFLREGERWICLGHVAHDACTPTLNQRHPRLQGVPY